MKTKLKVYNFNNHDIRIIIDQDLQPYFCLLDITDALRLSNARVVAQRLDPDEVRKFDLRGKHGITNFVTEGGMYSVILRSDSVYAKPMQKWVTGEVLPSIRKFGAYMTPDKIEDILSNPDTIIKLATQLKEAKLELEQAGPKIILANAIEASSDSILIGQLAKIISQNGVPIGQNRLLKWMRLSGFLCSKGRNYNMPIQRYVESGLFEVQEICISVPGKEPKISFTTKVTGKGQIYFINKFLKPAS